MDFIEKLYNMQHFFKKIYNIFKINRVRIKYKNKKNYDFKNVEFQKE